MKPHKHPILHSSLTLASAAWLLPFAGTHAEDPVTPPVFSDSLNIDNPYHPIVPNRVKIHVSQQGHTEEIVLEVHSTETRRFTLSDGAKVDCVTLYEIEFEDGELVEVSKNFFGQADDKTLYYFGETVDDFEGGVVTGHGGSWLVGGPSPSDPAETATALEPAVFMPGNPEVGDVFKPEDLFPLVDETAEIIKSERTVITPAGQFKDSIKVLETTMLSDDTEYKWYAPLVGVIKAAGPSEVVHLLELIDNPDDASREELVMDLIEEISGDEEVD